LPTNHIPKGLIPLENLSYQNDVEVKPQLAEVDVELEDYNLGTT